MTYGERLRNEICSIDIHQHYRIPGDRYTRLRQGGYCGTRTIVLDDNQVEDAVVMDCGLKINDRQYYFFGRGRTFLDVYLYICAAHDMTCEPIQNIQGAITPLDQQPQGRRRPTRT